jgi:hypothetical protein
MIHTTMNNGRSGVLARDAIDETVVEALRPLANGCVLNRQLGLEFQRVCDPFFHCALWSIVDSVTGKAFAVAMQCWEEASASQAWETVETAWLAASDRAPELYDDDSFPAEPPAVTPWVAVVRWHGDADERDSKTRLLEQLERHIAFAILDDEGAAPLD